MGATSTGFDSADAQPALARISIKNKIKRARAGVVMAQAIAFQSAQSTECVSLANLAHIPILKEIVKPQG
jgi:hypothetical protein